MSSDEINEKDSNGFTALHVAARRGHIKIVELLLQNGASCTVLNRYNHSPLEEAKNEKIKQMIRRSIDQTRFIGSDMEWILSIDKIDYKAYQYWKILEVYGKDPECHKLIEYIKKNYIEKDLQYIDGIAAIKKYFDTAINKRDPIYLLQAFVDETEFHSRINVHLAELQLENLSNHEYFSRAYYIGIIGCHPTFEKFSYLGTTFRCMMITENDLKQYEIATRLLTKTILSSSKLFNIALESLSNRCDQDNRLITICVFEIRNRKTALDVQKMSPLPYEEEVLILPYSVFKVINIQIDKSQTPNVEIKLKECEPW